MWAAVGILNLHHMTVMWPEDDLLLSLPSFRRARQVSDWLFVAVMLGGRPSNVLLLLEPRNILADLLSFVYVVSTSSNSDSLKQKHNTSKLCDTIW